MIENIERFLERRIAAQAALKGSAQIASPLCRSRFADRGADSSTVHGDIVGRLFREFA